jgi:hypothetical protein
MPGARAQTHRRHPIHIVGLFARQIVDNRQRWLSAPSILLFTVIDISAGCALVFGIAQCQSVVFIVVGFETSLPTTIIPDGAQQE